MSDTEAEAAAVSAVAPFTLARLRRLGGYAFWSAAAFTVPVAIDRLLVFPILNHHLGEAVFGAFVWVLGVMSLVRRIVSNGFALNLLRRVADYKAADANRLMRTALLLCLASSMLILGLTAPASYPIADGVVQAHGWPLYVTLHIYSVLFCVEAIVVTSMRVERRFRAIFVLKVIEAVVLGGNVLVAPTHNLWLVGLVYSLSILLALPVGMRASSHFSLKNQWWDRGFARFLTRSWFGGAWITFAEQSRVYAAPMLVGVFVASADVTVLVAGTSIGNIFVMPIGMAGGLVLSLLSGRKDFPLGGRRGYVYAAACGAFAVLVGIASYAGGWLLVRYLYPNVAERTLAFYHWIAIANGATALVVLVKPVALKYALMRNIAGLSLATLIVEWLALFVLVPLAGPAGAAFGLALASLVAMGLWLGYYLRLVRDPRRAAEPAGGVPPPPPEDDYAPGA